MSEDKISKESQAVSAMTVINPKKFDMAISAKSESKPSLRDMNEQVTEGRFEPLQLNADC